MRKDKMAENYGRDIEGESQGYRSNLFTHFPVTA
jgi:hypothetical protein